MGKNLILSNMKQLFILSVLSLCFTFTLSGQGGATEAPGPISLSDEETAYLRTVAVGMCESDQRYRNYLAKGTLDDAICDRIDSVFNNVGIEAGWAYEKSLGLSLPKVVEDSLWELQHQIDFTNHLTLRGMIKTYGWLSKEVLGESHYIQTLLLLHPPKDWDIRRYMVRYTDILLPEVEAGRMEPVTYASFIDNMRGKILREPQLYGTNGTFDAKTGKVLPPVILDLAESNAARKVIGMPALKEGEYRLAGE